MPRTLVYRMKKLKVGDVFSWGDPQYQDRFKIKRITRDKVYYSYITWTSGEFYRPKEGILGLIHAQLKVKI